MDETKSNASYGGFLTSKITCPCCKKEFNIHEYALIPSEYLSNKTLYYSIKCPQCGLKTDSYPTQERAFEAWKNREFANWTESAKAFYRKK